MMFCRYGSTATKRMVSEVIHACEWECFAHTFCRWEPQKKHMEISDLVARSDQPLQSPSASTKDIGKLFASRLDIREMWKDRDEGKRWMFQLCYGGLAYTSVFGAPMKLF